MRLGMKADQCDARITIEVERVGELRDIDIGLCRQERAIDAELAGAKIALLEGALDRALVWYRHPVFVSAVTGILVTGVIVLARYLLVEIVTVQP